MLGGTLLGILFMCIPVGVLAMFVISLCRYTDAKKRNRTVPGTFSHEEIEKRKTMLIIFSVIAAAIFAIMTGLIILMSMALAHM